MHLHAQMLNTSVYIQSRFLNRLLIQNEEQLQLNSQRHIMVQSHLATNNLIVLIKTNLCSLFLQNYFKK